MSNKILVSLLATFAFMASAVADHHEGAMDGEAKTEKKPFAIYGDFAGSWTMQGNEYSGPTVASGNSQASPAQHDSFAVDNAFLNVEKNWSKSKLHLQVGYGTYQGRFSPTSANTLNLFNAYYAHDYGSGFSWMFGKYDSAMGYESYKIMDNRQYTRSWAFGQHNYLQTGLGVAYDINGMANVGFHVSNGTQGSGTENDNNKNKSMTLAVGVTAVENLAIDLKYQTGVDTDGGAITGGNHDNTVMEVTVAYMVNESFDFAIDYLSRKTQAKVANSTEATATSIAAYLNGNFGLLGASLRYEMFDYDYLVPNSAYSAFTQPLSAGTNPTATPGTDNSISSITVSVHYDMDQNARAILEYRMDSADDKVFTDKDGAAADGADTITLGLMYRF